MGMVITWHYCLYRVEGVHLDCASSLLYGAEIYTLYRRHMSPIYQTDKDCVLWGISHGETT